MYLTDGKEIFVLFYQFIHVFEDGTRGEANHIPEITIHLLNEMSPETLVNFLSVPRAT